MLSKGLLLLAWVLLARGSAVDITISSSGSQNIQVVTHVRRSPTICDYLYLEEALEEAVINDFETIYQAVIICLRELLGSSSRLTSMRRGDLSMTAGTVG